MRHRVAGISAARAATGLQRANSAVNLVAKVRVQGDRIIREVEAQDQKVEKYIAAVRRYCLGEDTVEHPLWTGSLAELSRKWEVPPRPYGEKSGAYLEEMASSANRHVDARRRLLCDVQQLVGSRYRAFPTAPTIEPVRGWFKWTISGTMERCAGALTDYLDRTAQFAEPPASGVEELVERLPSSADDFRAIADSAAGLTEAAARRDLKPAEFGRSVDAHVDRAAAGVRRLDGALRRLVSEHAV